MGRFAHVVHLRVDRKELATLRRMAAMRDCTIEEMIRRELLLTDGDEDDPPPPPALDPEQVPAPPQLKIIEGGGEEPQSAARSQAQDVLEAGR